MKVALRIALGFLFLLSLLSILSFLGIGNENPSSLATGQFVPVAQEQIRVVQKGEGQDILLIHGTPGSIEDWAGIMDKLAMDFRVTAFDRPGHGYSSANEYEYHISDNARLAEILIRQLDLQSPLIVGHSYGGSTAVKMAVNGNVDARGYVVIDSPLFNVHSEWILRITALPVIGPGIALLAKYILLDKKVEEGVKAALANQTPEVTDRLVKERQKLWAQPKVIYAKAKEMVNYQSDLNEMIPAYSDIQAPMILISGTDTGQTYRKDCEQFHALAPNSELQLLDNTAHYVQFDQPERVLSILRSAMHPSIKQ